ncbi:MAG: hypothetical protein Q9225_003281 [Loekoesia sp. 1 TL-2023]
MFYFIDQNSSSYGRRHAIKPDEAEFLKRNPPGLIASWPNQKLSRNAQDQQKGTEGIGPRIHFSGIRNTRYIASWSLTTKRIVIDLETERAPTPFAHTNQHPSVQLKGKGLDDPILLSKISTETRPDHKRKYDAVSEAEQDLDPSSTAIDVIHPSEIRLDDEEFKGLNMDLRGEFPIKVRNTVCFKDNPN